MKIGKFEVGKKGLLIAAAALVVIIFGGVVFPYGLMGASEDNMVYVYPNMTQEAFRDSVEVRLGSYGGRVATLVNLMNVDLSKRVGAYSVNEGESPARVARHIQRGGQSGVKFTFNNLRTKEQFAERVGEKLLMTQEDMLNALNDTAFCKKFGKTPETIVTVLMPDSYEFYWTATPEEVVNKLNDNYKDFWTEARKLKAQALGLSPDEITTVASIVEEETAQSDERGKVARLYMNRLNSGMMLQADPTVKFALGDFSIKRITKDMLKTDSPYNTYRYLGLPPGPIRIPDKSTIDAVLNAPTHNYTYMCAKEDFSGYHNFTTSYSEHLANAARYQAELNKRGIK